MQRRPLRIIEGEIQWWIFKIVLAGMFLCVAITTALVVYLLDVIKMTLAFVPRVQLNWLLDNAVEATALAAMVQVALIAAAGFYALYASQKIAGPIYRIKADLKAMEESGEYRAIHTRDGDKLQALVDQLNRVLTSEGGKKRTQ